MISFGIIFVKLYILYYPVTMAILRVKIMHITFAVTR
jgi:hypothetical protein